MKIFDSSQGNIMDNASKSGPDKSDQKKSFKDTLNLPTTDFPIRANLKELDSFMLKRWQNDDIYVKTFLAHKGHKKFILHDGPPFANGHIHLGTSYNKILKDIEAKAYRMANYQVPITPGWDCHGLPIELAVARDYPQASPNELRQKCRAYARKWVTIQREEFKALGVMMDWDHPYLTMDFSYEASVLQAFSIFVKNGYIERKNKTVPWCASCQTVLASAEIEYKDRQDPSLYVLFEIDKKRVSTLFPNLANKPIYLLVWTTTPWTLPLNRAVFLKPKTPYQVLEHEGTLFVVAKDLADAICKEKGIEKKVVGECTAEDLKGISAKHPFVNDLQIPILTDEFVSLDDGTACVHSAPGCGPEDYEVGIKNNLEIFSPLSPDGRYTVGIKPADLEWMSIFEGNDWVLKTLSEKGVLFYQGVTQHSYPHCWRCRKPLMFRATKQWFCDLTKHDLKKRALAAVDTISFIPKNAKNSLKASIEARLEWCLSRQRTWGVPIPAVLCDECDYAYTDAEFIEAVSHGVAQQGVEYWEEVDLSSLLPSNFVCPKCGSKHFHKEDDILDVWFESGITHYAVLLKDPELSYPANVYLEAVDQNRGWFQSSLLASLVLEEEPCTKTIVCHGYTVDAEGRKMSKSLGNVVAPQEVIDQIGADGLRLWVSSIDIGSDVIVSKQLLGNIAEVYRKIRNTERFLLSNLFDFDKKRDALPFEKLLPLDQYALLILNQLNEQVQQYYFATDFTRVFHDLTDYVTAELSSFYLDIIKDRLYVELAHGDKRRSAQTVCWYILDTLVRLMAPICSFTAEHISDFYQKDKKESIHLQCFADLKSVVTGTTKLAHPYELSGGASRETLSNTLAGENKLTQWQTIKKLRSALLKAIERQREKGLIKHPLEAQISLFIDSSYPDKKLLEQFFTSLERQGQSKDDFLKELMIVSQITFAPSKENLEETNVEGLYALVEKAAGVKCPRCWQWEVTQNEDGLCQRCQKVVSVLSKK